MAETKQKPFIEWIFVKKIFEIFILIKNKKPLIKIELSKKADVTYDYLCKKLNDFLKIKVIYFEKKNNRAIYVLLTEKGKKLQYRLLEIKEILKE